MTPILIIAVAGISGLKACCSRSKRRRRRALKLEATHQRQSAIALLSYAVVALLVMWLSGPLRRTDNPVRLCFFFIFSGLNHGLDAIKNKNYKWQNINRPFITLLMIAGLLYPVIMALKGP